MFCDQQGGDSAESPENPWTVTDPVPAVYQSHLAHLAYTGDAPIQSYFLRNGKGSCMGWLIETNTESQTKWRDKGICSKGKSKIKLQNKTPNETDK